MKKENPVIEVLTKKFGKPHFFPKRLYHQYVWTLGEGEEAIELYFDPKKEVVHVYSIMNVTPAYSEDVANVVPTKELSRGFREIKSLAEQYRLKHELCEPGESPIDAAVYGFLEILLGPSRQLYSRFEKEIKPKEENLEETLYEVEEGISDIKKVKEEVGNKLKSWRHEITIRAYLGDSTSARMYLDHIKKRIKTAIEEYKNKPDEPWWIGSLDLRRLFFEPRLEPTLKPIVGEETFENIKSSLDKDEILDWHHQYTEKLFSSDKQETWSRVILGNRRLIHDAAEKFKKTGKMPEFSSDEVPRWWFEYLADKKLSDFILNPYCEQALRTELGDKEFEDLKHMAEEYKPQPEEKPEEKPKKKRRSWLKLFTLSLLIIFFSSFILFLLKQLTQNPSKTGYFVYPITLTQIFIIGLFVAIFGFIGIYFYVKSSESQFS